MFSSQNETQTAGRHLAIHAPFAKQHFQAKKKLVQLLTHAFTS